tara:strand:- start:612 stop:1643 length:1032 start_codon:yes stop_codon:yes gene_type:complete
MNSSYYGAAYRLFNVFVLIYIILLIIIIIVNAIVGVGSIASVIENEFTQTFLISSSLAISMALSLLQRKEFAHRWFLGRQGEGGNRSNVENEFLMPDSDGVKFSDVRDHAKRIVLIDMDKRIDKLDRKSNIILFGAAASLVAAAFVVIFAGRLASLDVEAVSLVDRVKTELENIDARISRINIAQGGRPDSVEKGAASGEFGSSRFTRGSDLILDPSLMEDLREQRKGLAKIYSQAFNKEINSPSGYSDENYIIFTAIIRIGVILVIVFLVQILMSLYRYNVRLSTFLSSRKDIITLCKIDRNNVDDVNSVFFNNWIDFGSEPKHPFVDLARLMRRRSDPQKE